jgi:hypothetical protein
MPESFVNEPQQGVSKEGSNNDRRRVKKMRAQQQLMLNKLPVEMFFAL